MKRQRTVIILRPGQLHRVASQVTYILIARGIHSDHDSFRVKGWLDNRIDGCVNFRKQVRMIDTTASISDDDGKTYRPMRFEDCCDPVDMPRGLVARVIADFEQHEGQHELANLRAKLAHDKSVAVDDFGDLM